MPKRTLLVTFSALAALAVGGAALFSRPATSATASSISSCATLYESVTLAADITTSSASCFVVAASNVTIDGNGHSITITNASTWDLRAVDILGQSHVTVKNLRSNAGIQVYGDAADYFTLQDSQLGFLSLYYADAALVQRNQLGGLVVQSQDNTFQANTITGTGQHVIDLNADTTLSGYGGCPQRGGNLFEDNVVTNNDPNTIAESTAIYVRCSQSNTFRRNTFRGVYNEVAMFIRDAADENVFDGNTFVANNSDRGAIFFGDGGQYVSDPAHNIFTRNIIRSLRGEAFHPALSSGGNAFRYNVFRGNGAQTAFIRVDPSAGGTDPDVYDHNTFYNEAATGAGLLIGTSTTAAWRHPTNSVFTNNIVSYAGPRAYNFEGTVDWANYRADYNLFNSRSGSPAFGAYDVDGNGTPETIGNLAAWQAATGSDAHSMAADPRFVDAPAGDFRLGSGSPAIGAGTNSTNIGAADAYLAVSSCTSNWQCTAWSACSVAGTQTRTCTDLNACGTTANKPPETQSCASVPPAPVDAVAPTVQITKPRPNDTVSGSRAQISAKAWDNAAVTKVEFYVDAALIGTDAVTPYSIRWDSRVVTNGTHTLTAKAYDAAGNVGLASLPFTAKNSLGGALTVASATSTVTGTVDLYPKAIYGRTTIVKVEYYEGRRLMATDTDSPYNLTLDTTTLKNGRHTLTAKLYDASGRTARISKTIRVKN